MALGTEAIRYAGVNARVRGLRAKLLDDEEWQFLLSAQSWERTLNQLKETPYRDIVTTAQQARRATIEQLEYGLTGKTAEDCRKVITFTMGQPRQVLEVWWQRFELENLKAIFRGVHQGMSPNFISRFMTPLGEHSRLPWDTLLHEQTVTGLIERLRDTHYVNPLRNALHAYQRDGTLFALEVALDIRYYRDLAAAVERLSGDDHKAARKLLGTHIDMLNILWAYRYRVYHGFSAEEIVNYTIWHSIRTDANLIREIALGAPPSLILREVWGDGVFDEDLLQRLDGARHMLPTLELALQRYWRHLAVQQMAGYPYGIGPLLGYLVLDKLEAQDLITLLEGKGMGWDAKRIRQHLVRTEE